jgi:pimeloyl-ACP methyl ester carboxylesterase
MKKLLRTHRVLWVLFWTMLAAGCQPIVEKPFNRPCALYLPQGEIAGKTIQCGFVRVPWDRSTPNSPPADLAYVLLKATGKSPRPAAIVHVAGGPGAGSTLRESVLELGKRYASLREEYDIVLYDQRGMGNSQPFFACAEPDEPTLATLSDTLAESLGRQPTADEQRAAFCAHTTAAQGYPASLLSTATSAADLVDLLEVLDYPAYTLYGVSYGTRLLMALMHFFPNLPTVRSIVLDSPYPLPEDTVNQLMASSEREFPELFHQLLAACASERACHTAYPELAEQYATVVETLQKTPLPLPDGSELTAEAFQRAVFPLAPAIGHVPYMPRLISELAEGNSATLMQLRSGLVPSTHHLTALDNEHPRTGELVDAFLACQVDLADATTQAAYDQGLISLWDAPPERVAAFLGELCAASSGNAASLLVQELPIGTFNGVIVRFAPELLPAVNAELNRKLLCTEEYPFATTGERVAQQLEPLDLPDFFVAEVAQRVDSQSDGCAGWPSRLTAPTPTSPGKYPVLILSGDFDPLTPPAFGQIAAEQLPASLWIRVPNATHSILGNYGPCIAALTQQFLEDPARPVDLACLQTMRIPWVLPEDTP